MVDLLTLFLSAARKVVTTRLATFRTMLLKLKAYVMMVTIKHVLNKSGNDNGIKYLRTTAAVVFSLMVADGIGVKGQKMTVTRNAC